MSRDGVWCPPRLLDQLLVWPVGRDLPWWAGLSLVIWAHYTGRTLGQASWEQCHLQEAGELFRGQFCSNLCEGSGPRVPVKAVLDCEPWHVLGHPHVGDTVGHLGHLVYRLEVVTQGQSGATVSFLPGSKITSC